MQKNCLNASVLVSDTMFNQETTNKHKQRTRPTVRTDKKLSLQGVNRDKSTKAVCTGCEKISINVCICLPKYRTSSKETHEGADSSGLGGKLGAGRYGPGSTLLEDKH